MTELSPELRICPTCDKDFLARGKKTADGKTVYQTYCSRACESAKPTPKKTPSE